MDGKKVAEKLWFVRHQFCRPILFVGNHTSLGMYDLPLLVHELHLRGFSCRALAHPIHWLGPTGAMIEQVRVFNETVPEELGVTPPSASA